MAPNNNNWQDFAADLGLSFEVDPNAPELPPEPEMVVGEEVIASEINQADAELASESNSEEVQLESGPEDANGNKRRRRGRRRRKGRGEGEEGSIEIESESLTPTNDDEESEGVELVGAGAGLSERRSARAENDIHHRPVHHHHHDDDAPADDDNFVLEDLSNLSLPSWTELIDSLYRPER